MKIRALEVDQFRRFDRPVRLSGFGNGVNVLCGPNEFGKSTLLEAIRGLLFERYTSKADVIKRMQPRTGAASPRLAMEFELRGERWHVAKRFLHREPLAVLTAPCGARFEGDAAEERLQELLGVTAPGKQGSKPEHVGLWSALLVNQRGSLNQADLSSDLARTTLAGCLDAEVGALAAGGERGRVVVRGVQAQLSGYLDGRGNPKGRTKEVIGLLAKAGVDLAALRQRQDRLRQDEDALAAVQAELARRDDPDGAKRDEEALADARQRREAALLHEERLESAKRAATLAGRALDGAREEQAARATRADATRTAQAALVGAEAREQCQSAEAADARKIEGEHAAALEAVQRRADAAATRVRRARQVVALAGLAADHAAHASALHGAEAAADRVNGFIARLDTLPVTLARIEAIRTAERALDRARAAWDAQAVRVEYALLPDAAGQVRVNGAVLDGTGATPILTDTDIEIAGVGRLTVLPAAPDKGKAASRFKEAEATLHAALVDAGCRDPDEAEVRWTERERMERNLADARAELARLAPGGPAGLLPGVGPLRAHVDVGGRRVSAATAGLGLATPPSALGASAEADAADAAAQELQDTLAQARAVHDAALRDHMDRRETLASAAAGAAAARTERDRLLRDAAQAEAREPATGLDRRVTEARDEHDRRRRDVETLERDRPEDAAPAMLARVQRYEQAIQGRREAVQKLREERSGLRARIAQEGGQGLGEQVAALERDQDLLTRERDAAAREVEVLTLLRDTLLDAEQEVKVGYLRPLVRRITPYLRGLFPGAELACGEDFRVESLSRPSRGDDLFDALSDGTQEQVSILVRLAFAEMLHDQGRPALLVLDDALAYSDADRMERMFDVLTQAGDKLQILVLTCRSDLFSRLGGTALTLETVV